MIRADEALDIAAVLALSIARLQTERTKKRRAQQVMEAAALVLSAAAAARRLLELERADALAPTCLPRGPGRGGEHRSS